MTYADLLQPIKELAGLITAFITILKFLDSIGQTPFQAAKFPADSPKLFRIIRLIQSTSESAWRLTRNISIFVYIVVLGFDVALVVGLVGALVVEGTNMFSGGMIVILTVIFGVPIYSLIDDYQTELRLRRGERSRVFKWAEIEIVANYDSLLLRCLQVLSDMGARVTHYNANIGVFLAELRKSHLVIEIRQLQNDQYTVHITSDSNLPTVKVDFGINRKYVDECAKRLLGYR